MTLRFIQVIEFTASRPEAIEALIDEWAAKTAGHRTAERGTLTADRDRPNSYVQIVEFPSHEAAMANSALPETADFAARLAELCDGPMAFRNLDVRSGKEL